MKQCKSRSNVLDLAGVWNCQSFSFGQGFAAEEMLTVLFGFDDVESSANAQRLREYVQGALQSRAKGAQSQAYNK
jgi:hypothetical protein